MVSKKTSVRIEAVPLSIAHHRLHCCFEPTARKPRVEGPDEHCPACEGHRRRDHREQVADPERAFAADKPHPGAHEEDRADQKQDASDHESADLCRPGRVPDRREEVEGKAYRDDGNNQLSTDLAWRFVMVRGHEWAVLSAIWKGGPAAPCALPVGWAVTRR